MHCHSCIVSAGSVSPDRVEELLLGVYRIRVNRKELQELEFLIFGRCISFSPLRTRRLRG